LVAFPWFNKKNLRAMSLALNPIAIQQALDPRVNLRETPVYSVFKGASTVTFQPTNASSYSTTSIVWTSNPPSPFVIVDRKTYAIFNLQLTFAGSGSGNLLSIGVTDAPRSWPLHRIINTTTVTLNNSSVNLVVYPVLSIIQRCNMPSEVRRFDMSMSCPMPDQAQTYSGLAGAVLSPLAAYGDNVDEVPRGGFSGISVVSNTNTSAVVNLLICEPLLVSPFTYGAASEKGFWGVQNCAVQMTLQSNLSRIWSHDAISGNTISSITVAHNAAPVMLWTYLTPNPVVEIPSSLAYSYFVIDWYETDAATTLAAGSSASLTSNVATLSEMPRQLFLAVRQRDADLTYNTSDVFAVINSCQISLNNQTGILASATQQDLYRMSMENGIDIPWSSWSMGCGVTAYSNGVGSVLLLVPGKDIGLPPTLASGVGGQFSLQVTVGFTNPAGNPAGAITYAFYILAIREGVFTLQQNRSIPQLNVLTPDNVLKSDGTPPISMPQRRAVSTMYGGDVHGMLKAAGHRLLGQGSSGGSVLGRARAVLGALRGVRRHKRRSHGRRGRGLDTGVMRGGALAPVDDESGSESSSEVDDEQAQAEAYNRRKNGLLR
jgi:hypothetical protein